MLTCLNITLEYQNRPIFRQLSLSLFPGSIYILKGTNGSGKTSLLKIIAGILKPNEGEVLWNNKPIIPETALSYLGHENAVKPNLSVIDNLLIWAELKNNFPLISPALGQFKLAEMTDIECKYLSAGWQKRVALARMVIGNGKLWLLDEPEANLDQEGRELLLKLLQIKIAAGGMAIIASHNLEYYQKIPVINIDDFKTC